MLHVSFFHKQFKEYKYSFDICKNNEFKKKKEKIW